MKAEELRIGNWVHHTDMWSYRNEDCKPFDFQFTLSDFYADGECTISIEELQPIQLTEEWLKKFGFSEKYKSTSNRWLKWGMNINAGLELHDCEDENGNTHGVFLHNFVLEIKHVHQLQNLYFALTGEELVLAVSAVTPNNTNTNSH